MSTKLQFYSEFAERTARQITGSYRSWTAFLATAARLYKYPYNEQLMIYAQRPNATACAEYDFWKDRIYERVTRNSAALKSLARSRDVPILCLCQLNRASEQRADRQPSMADLRDSGAIEQDADAVILLHRPAMYEPKQQLSWEAQTLTAIVAKNRHGSTGSIKFDFWGAPGIIRESKG